MASHVYTGRWQLALHQKPLALSNVIQVVLGREGVLGRVDGGLVSPVDIYLPRWVTCQVTREGTSSEERAKDSPPSQLRHRTIQNLSTHSAFSLLPTFFLILLFTRFVSHLKRHEQ